MRLFVSIDFPGNICEKIYSLIPELEGWRRTPVGQIHLTLYFLGDCTAEEKREITEKLNQVIFQPFTIEISGFGVFPNQRKPKVLWCGIRNDHEIISLQQQVASKLYRFKKKPDEKKYIPHITLARKKLEFGKKNLINHILNREYPVISVDANQFLLKESIPKPDGREHKVLEKFQTVL